MLLLALAQVARGQPVVHHYGSIDAGIDLSLEAETPDGPWHLNMQRDDGDGYEALIPPLQLRAGAGEGGRRIFAGRGLVAGRAATIRIRIDGEADALEWLEPTQFRFPGAAPLPMAGGHPRLTDAARAADAKARFAATDAALNALYAELRAHLPAEAFDALRANQRRWLGYRHRFIADGDNYATDGPGTTTFIREQTRRTHARIDFLRAVRTPRAADDGISGRYDDGLGRSLSVALVSGADRQILVSLDTSGPSLHARDLHGPLSLSGSASPATEGKWEAESGAIAASQASHEPAEMLFEHNDADGSILVSEARGEVFGGRYYRTGDATAAHLPMRELIRRLPASAFDDTEEGLSANDKLPLLLTGKSEFFTLQQPGCNFIRLRYGVGQVELRRFARRDGGAAVAVVTTNVRVRTFALWLFPADGGDPARIDPGHPPLPPLPAAEFFAQAGNAPLVEPWRYDYALDEDLAEIRVRLLPDGASPAPDRGVALIWDGYGLGVVQVDP